MRVGAATLNQTPLDWDNNIRNISDAIQEARSNQIRLLCLPELCLTGYGCEDLFLSDWVSKKSVDLLVREIIPKTEGIAVNIGIPLKVEGNIYNCTVLVDNGKPLSVYAKHFLANDGVHYESRWFTPWTFGRSEEINLGEYRVTISDQLTELEGEKVGFEICEDAWRPERPGISYSEERADIIINPSASPFEIGKSARRRRLAEISSQLFDCTYVYVNLLGNESGRLIFDGEALIASEGKIYSSNERFSYKPYNLIYDENDPYISEPNEEFRRAVCLGFYDYLRKSRTDGFVISLSGGADSGCCAVLVSEMVKIGEGELGKESFWNSVKANNLNELLCCAYQATKNSSNVTNHAAKSLSEELGCTYFEWDIDDEVDGAIAKIEFAIGRELNWDKDDIALQNIQARARSPFIWLLANIKNALLITTSNRSEGTVGYATMDGDTSGSIAPIAGIDKTFIRNWLKHAESDLGYASLKYINEQQPTAELRPQEENQTDEADLMPYDVLLDIERKAIGEYLSPIGVYDKLKDKYRDHSQLKEWIAKFFRLWSRTQWKRERIAPSFHLDAHNVDPRSWFRFPILSGGYESELKELMSN